MSSRFHRWGLLLLLAPPVVSLAGGGPQNVLLVVNDNSLESLELGQYYREKRGIPGANVFHIQTATNWSINTAAFSNQIRGPILNYIAMSGLSNQIDYVVFSRGIPYRVYEEPYSNNRFSGLTASMFYDFKSSSNAFIYGCDLAVGSASAYYETERAFTHAGPPGSNYCYLSALLQAWTLNEAKTLVDRSVEADQTSPTGTVYLMHSSDPDRNIRWTQFDHVVFQMRFLGSPLAPQAIDADDLLGGKTNVMGVMAGWTGISDLYSSLYCKGSLGDHLTSYGGSLFDSMGQMSILAWIYPYAGCVGSYGTVVEPCSYTNKFPQARLYYWYGRGFNMGESYQMSVQNPYQGVFVGDPLCAPYAVPPSLSLSGLISNQTVSGTVTVTVTGVSAAGNQKVDKLDLFRDGVYLATVTNLLPARSNVVSATIMGTERTYVLRSNDTLFGAVTGLVAAINQAPSLGVTARAYGDRIQIVQNTRGTTGAWMTVSASSTTGSASRLGIFAWSVTTNFMETVQYAHQQVTLNGTPVSGDVVRAVVTDLNSVMVTNEAKASTNDTAWALISRLAQVVGSNTTLQSSTGCEMTWLCNGPIWGTGRPVSAYFRARTNTWQGYNLYLVYSVVTQLGSSLTGPGFSTNFSDNGDALSARATIFMAQGSTNLAASYVLNTTNMADGPHELTAIAYDGSAVKTQQRIIIPFAVDNNSATCSITNPPDGATFLQGEIMSAQVSASSGVLITSVQFYAEGKMLSATGTSPYVFAFNTTNYGVGVLGLQAKALCSNGQSVLSARLNVTILPDYDSDGLDDNWEIRYFGSITNYTGASDPDTDGADNRNEYIADTQPTNDMSFFKVSRIDWIGGLAVLEFVSSTARQYRMNYNDASLMDGLWQDSSNWLWGGIGVTTQADDGTVMPLPTNALRFYRVRAHRP